MQSAEVPEMSLVPRNYLLLYCWDGHYDLASFTFSVRFISWIPKATLLPQKLLLPSTMQMLGAEAHISIYNARKPRQEDIGIAWPDRSAWTDSTRFTEGPSFKKENNVTFCYPSVLAENSNPWFVVNYSYPIISLFLIVLF